MEQVKNVIIGIFLSVLAFLKPIEGELWSLAIHPCVVADALSTHGLDTQSTCLN